jgi:hypothetical protein
VPDFLVKLTQATVCVINYRYCLTMQDDAVRSSAEDRDGANLVATGGAPDLEEESARFCQGEQVPGSAVSPDGAFFHGLAHQAERVASVADNEPPQVRTIGRQFLLVDECSHDGVELDVRDGQEADVDFRGQSLSAGQVDAFVSDPRELTRIKGPHYSFFFVVVVYLGYWSVWPPRITDLVLG